MKAAVYYDVDDIRVEEIPTPVVADDEVLLRVKVCGLCGTDLSKIFRKTVEPPAVLGHEIAGEIVKLGKRVKGFQIGDRVFAAHHVPCFVCWYCRHGNYSSCSQFKQNNFDPGGFSQIVRILSQSVQQAMLNIPDELSDEEASLIEPIACCLRSLDRCRLFPGDSVLILGAGPVGLLHVQLAWLYGAANVFVTDLRENRLKIAEQLGACALKGGTELKEKIRDTTEGRGIDIVIVAVGIPAVISEALDYIRCGGTINIFAESPPGSELNFDPNLIYHSEVNLIGTYSSTPIHQRTAMELLKTGRIKVKQLITHRFGLEALQEAVKLAVNPDDALKIVIVP